MKTINWKALALSLAFSLGVGAFSGFITADSRETYETLYKPPLAPPGWIFPIVWTILFLLMGVASYLVYISKTNEEEKRQALILYVLQLFVNVGWSVIFFRWDAYLLAFVWLLLLWYLIFLTIKNFYEINSKTGKLLIPYLLWVTFAGYLNLAIAIHYF